MEEKLVKLLRFASYEEIKEAKPEIVNYIDKLFMAGVSDSKLFNPVIVKLTVYPGMFEEICTPYIGMDTITFTEYLETKNRTVQYFNNYVALTDHHNLLESEIADIWGQSQGRGNNYIKYILIKTAFKLGITNPDDSYFIWGGNIVKNRDLRLLRKYNYIFKNIFNDHSYHFPFDFENNLLTAFKELWHEKQNKSFKESLFEGALNEQMYRWLKEIQLINFNPEFYLANKDYFDINIDALENAIRLVLTYSKDKLTKEELEDLKQKLNDLETKRQDERYMAVVKEFDNLPNKNEIVRNFSVFDEEYNKGKQIKK